MMRLMDDPGTPPRPPSRREKARWAELAAWLDDAITAAREDWRAWEGWQPGTPRAAEAAALERVRAKMDEIDPVL